MKSLKNILDLKIIENIGERKLGLVFHTNILFFLRNKSSNVNKITTLYYLSCLKNQDVSLELYPKFPNFYCGFDSIAELDHFTIMDSIFIKIKNIFWVHKNVSLQFFINKFLVYFIFFFLIF